MNHILDITTEIAYLPPLRIDLKFKQECQSEKIDCGSLSLDLSQHACRITSCVLKFVFVALFRVTVHWLVPSSRTLIKLINK